VLEKMFLILLLIFLLLGVVFTAMAEDPAYQVFLRKTTVILSSYQQSVSFALQHKISEFRGIIYSRVERELSIALSYHLGLPKGVEVYSNLPVLWGVKIDEDYLEQIESKSDKSGVGDLSLGAKFIFLQEKGSVSDIIGTLEVGLPTGDDPYSLNSENLGLGSGHWSLSLGLAMIKFCDPVVVYGGLAHTYLFEKSYNGRKIQPGGIIVYNLGMAFAINDRMTLGKQVIGSYEATMQIDSEEVLFSSSEPIMLKSSLTYALSKNAFIEPSVLFGLNNDAGNVAFNLSYSRRF